MLFSRGKIQLLNICFSVLISNNNNNMTTQVDDGLRQRFRRYDFTSTFVERDLSLPSNSLVDGAPSPKISGEVRLKEMIKSKLHGDSTPESYSTL